MTRGRRRICARASKPSRSAQPSRTRAHAARSSTRQWRRGCPHLVGLVARRGEHRLPRAAARELRLDVGLREREAGGHCETDSQPHMRVSLSGCVATQCLRLSEQRRRRLCPPRRTAVAAVRDLRAAAAGGSVRRTAIDDAAHALAVRLACAATHGTQLRFSASEHRHRAERAALLRGDLRATCPLCRCAHTYARAPPAASGA